MAARIDEYLAVDPDRRVTVELHGGEPLLLGQRRFRQLAQTLSTLEHSARLDLALQTNGVLFDESCFALLYEFGASFSISWDGDVSVHDRHRKF